MKKSITHIERKTKRNLSVEIYYKKVLRKMILNEIKNFNNSYKNKYLRNKKCSSN